MPATHDIGPWAGCLAIALAFIEAGARIAKERETIFIMRLAAAPLPFLVPLLHCAVIDGTQMKAVKPVLDKLSADVRAVVNSREFADRVRNLGIFP